MCVCVCMYDRARERERESVCGVSGGLVVKVLDW